MYPARDVAETKLHILLLGKRKYMCFRFPDPKHFIVNCDQNIVKYGGKCSEKYDFYIKYFDKPYLAFSELKPETHIYFFFFLPCRIHC